MNRIFYAERDTTLYEKHPEQNTGIDEILELTKTASGSRLNGEIQANTYNTRFLVDFGTEITTIQNEISNGNIPALSNENSTSASVFLNIRATDASDLLQSYTIEAYPISESWDNGRGRFDDLPKDKVGCSWRFRSGDAVAQSGVYWNTGSAHSKETSQGTTEIFGGGTWITGSGFEASQSFQNEAPDIRMDVTNIVRKWTSGDITNNGFIIKRTYPNEIDGVNRGSIKFFGRESHTIFVPKLEVCWDDSNINDTGKQITSNTYVPYFKNIKAEYRTSEITRFFVGVRPEFPSKTYQTSSFYLTGDTLPLSSSYEIIDSATNEIIVKDEKVFSSSKTKISQTSALGSFFDLRMDSFMPERFYKIKLTCRRTNDTQTFDDFYFKVVN
tara:strand:- start:532 stop:1689 length:1158 start_codon:yes stop_codon:yes gene_type:complete